MVDGSDARATGLSLIFAPGARPTLDDLESALGTGATSARLTWRSENRGAVELLASGLAFDGHGFAPGPAVPPFVPAQVFGIDDAPDPAACEAIAIEPSRHLAAAAAMLPVVRTLVGLGADLALAFPTVAVGWGPASTWIEPRYFSRTVMGWLGGGAFPALGLTRIEADASGRVRTSGLAHLVGQELELEAAPGEAPADTVKLAVRMADYCVRHGPIGEIVEIAGGGQVLVAEPSRYAKLVRVWRRP